MTICSVCCATKRGVEIQCPESCPHLAAARHHPPAVVQRRYERDLDILRPCLAGTTDRQYALLLWLHASTADQRATAVPALRDDDLVAAAGSLASTLETEARGIIYEHAPATITAQRVIEDYKRALADLEKDSGTRLARDASAALRLLERLGRQVASKEQTPTALIELLDRLSAPRVGAPGNNAPEEPGPDEPRVRLV